jgi:ABC-type bacteriocin/lantibiotic exporter with double-glycine peptidase domain
MPSDWLRVPHHKQSQEGLCLPACARMVLAYLGQDTDEAHLAQVLKTRPFGTPADNIRFLGKLGYVVLFERGAESDLRHWLDQGSPCIVFLKTEALPYWKTEHAHAVVLTGLSGDMAYVNDPAFDEAPQSIPLDHFLLAWSEFDYEYAVITPA